MRAGLLDIVLAFDALGMLGAELDVRSEEYRYTPGTVVGRVEGVMTAPGADPVRYFRDVTFCFRRVRWEVRDELLTLIA